MFGRSGTRLRTCSVGGRLVRLSSSQCGIYMNPGGICHDHGEKGTSSCVAVRFLEHGGDTAPRRRLNETCNSRMEPATNSMDLNKGPHPHGRKRAFVTVTVETSHASVRSTCGRARQRRSHWSIYARVDQALTSYLFDLGG